jgi:hypothetical protein
MVILKPLALLVSPRARRDAAPAGPAALALRPRRLPTTLLTLLTGVVVAVVLITGHVQYPLLAMRATGSLLPGGSAGQ